MSKNIQLQKVSVQQSIGIANTGSASDIIEDTDALAMSLGSAEQMVFIHEAAERILADCESTAAAEGLIMHLHAHWGIGITVLRNMYKGIVLQRRIHNQVGLFLNIRCHVDPEHEECLALIVEEYAEFAKANKFDKLDTATLINAIGQMAPITFSKNTVYWRGKATKAIKGLSIKTVDCLFSYKVRGAEF